MSEGPATVGRMRLLHTSDWHIGRTFHGHSTLPHLRGVLAGLAELTAREHVDAVLVAGDVFDSAAPSAEAFLLFEQAVGALREAGAVVVMTSGNHDSVARLGHQARFAAAGGVHVRTRHERLDDPVVLRDAHGVVDVYGIPYLEPVLVRAAYPDAVLKTHHQVLTHAMDRVRSTAAARGNRSVVLSHCFAAGVRATDVERDISAGGVDLVPAGVFDGPDYVALGHIHGRARLTERVRYSGAPLHYSFGERRGPRGAWLVQLDAAGLAGVEWRDLPVPRPLTQLQGELQVLLTDPALADREQHWIAAVLTDAVRQQDAMARLQARFPFAVQLEHRPPAVAGEHRTYTERMRGRSDVDVVGDFLQHVRGARPDAEESALLGDVLATVAARESAA